MSDDRYGNTRVAKIRAAYNDLRSALAEGDMGAAQAAFARYEQWSDYILDKRHSDRISALEARVNALTGAVGKSVVKLDHAADLRAALQENTDA